METGCTVTVGLRTKRLHAQHKALMSPCLAVQMSLQSKIEVMQGKLIFGSHAERLPISMIARAFVKLPSGTCAAFEPASPAAE